MGQLWRTTELMLPKAGGASKPSELDNTFAPPFGRQQTQLAGRLQIGSNQAA